MKEERVKLINKSNKVYLSFATMISVIIAIVCTRYLLMMLWGAVEYDRVDYSESDVQLLITIFSVSSVFFWAIAIRLLIKILKVTPVLELERDGIVQNGGFIPWESIEKIAMFTLDTGYNSRRYLGIWVKDLNALCNTYSKIRAEEIKNNVILGAAPISIEENMLEESIETTIKRIYMFRKKVQDEKRGD